MRKGLILALLITVIALTAGPVFASGLSGVRFGVEFGNPSVVGIVRLSMVDIKFGYDFTALGNQSAGRYLFLATDIRVVNNYPITGPLNFFLCAGAFIELMLDGTSGGANLVGFRLPLGLDILLFNNAVELFAEIVPTLGIIPALQPLGGGLQGWIGFTFAMP